MNRSPFAHASILSRGTFAVACFALVLVALFDSKFPFAVHAQSLVADYATASYESSTAALSSADRTFLDLAASIGQTAPARRLIDYKLSNDPTVKERYWAIVDFSQPSTSKRLYVFDTVNKTIERYYVAHGRGSGENIAERFSNQSGSNSSSLGIYRTLNEYGGNHGRSLRLQGLEPTNSNAFSRAVVMHTADYVSDAFIRRTGRLGRSEGCFAVEKSVGDALIDKLKDGAYIIASKN